MDNARNLWCEQGTGTTTAIFFLGWSNYPTGFCGELNVNSKSTHSVWDLDIPGTFESESQDISIPVQPHTSNQIIRTIEKCHSKVTKEIIVTIIVSIIIHRPVMATSSFYRHFQIESQGRVSAISEHILGGNGIHLHWIDNYARFISRSSMYLNQDLFRQCYWTAHGIKVYSPCDISLHNCSISILATWIICPMKMA